MSAVDRASKLFRYTFVECVECGRVFDILNEVDADEVANGHDCEVTR